MEKRLVALLICGLLIALTLSACDAIGVPPRAVEYPRDLVEAQQTAQAANINLSVYLTAVAQKTGTAQAISANQTQVAQTATAAPRATETARAATAEHIALTNQRTATASAQQTNSAWTPTISAQQTATAKFETVRSADWTRTAVPSQTNVAATKTQVAAAPTQTTIAEQLQTAIKREQFERDVQGWKSIVVWIVLICLPIAFIVIVLLLARAAAARMRFVGDNVRDGVMIHDQFPYPWMPPHPLLSAPGAGVVIDSDGRSVFDPRYSDGALRVQQLAALPERTGVRVVRELLRGDETTAIGDLKITKPDDFTPKPLRLETLPHKLSLPIGTAGDGSDKMIPLSMLTHGLVAGASGMGKTRLLHAWIAALQYGGQCDLVTYDGGKNGVEFGRYADTRRMTYIESHDLLARLEKLMGEMESRNALLRQVGATNLPEYNRVEGVVKLAHLVFIGDEIADIKDVDGAERLMIRLMRESRASGMHIFLATQYPDSKTIDAQVLANAMLRIAFSVPHHVNSIAALGCAGADKLGGMRGRMLVSYGGQLFKAQAYEIDLPNPRTNLLPAAESVKQINPPHTEQLDDNVRAMVRWAIEQGGGMFVATKIADALNMRDGDVSAVGQILEERGLLSKVIKDEHGWNVGRHIADELRGMV